MLVISTLHIAAIVAAYLIGSLSSAIILCKLAGLPDPRSEGSGNPGATNVLRIGGKKLAVMVLFIDVVKGVLPVAIVGMAGFNLTWVAATAFAVFLGHLYPVFFQFKGGKGVAVYLGILFSFSINLSMLFVVSWLIILFFSKYSSLSSLVTTLLIFIYSIIFKSFNESTFFFIIFIIIIYTHRENIIRLKNKKENKIKF